jgi:hypothetical protein
MRTRALGREGLHVSAQGLGCMDMSSGYGAASGKVRWLAPLSPARDDAHGSKRTSPHSTSRSPPSRSGNWTSSVPAASATPT